MSQGKRATAREVVGTRRGHRLDEVHEHGEQALIKLGRGRRFFGALELFLNKR
jgi:hypothetical protein